MAENKPLVSLNIRDEVSKRYGEIAQSGGSCCGGGAQSLGSHGNAIGYSDEELANLPEGANLGLGCGNPTTLAMIEPGMTVVDLGSGAGIDCFLVAPKVGPTGKVIGVDMTDNMLESATKYAAKMGYDNVEFRKGFIEDLPLDDASVDLIISNCVVNLSPDKAKVFQECARVLKPGGRIAVSDIVLLKPLPEALKADFEAYVGCITGASMIDDYLGYVKQAGLTIEKSDRKGYNVVDVLGCSPEAGKLIEKLPKDFDSMSHVTSLDLVATKAKACCGPKCCE